MVEILTEEPTAQTGTTNMKYLAITKTTGKPPKDFNKWMQYIHRESGKLNHLIKKQS